MILQFGEHVTRDAISAYDQGLCHFWNYVDMMSLWLFINKVNILSQNQIYHELTRRLHNYIILKH